MSESAKVVQDTNPTFEKLDKLGRVVKIRKAGMLKQYRLVAMLGKLADSDRYMMMVSPLIYLCSFDGDDSIGFSTVREMEGVIARIGEEGMETLVELVNEHFGETDPEEGKKKIKE